ncbi:MAG: hypothetical protein KAW13_03375 [Dehalococcoidia bacterium]|nr:hypothetical protein [Dehalococcoidia bacterium]
MFTRSQCSALCPSCHGDAWQTVSVIPSLSPSVMASEKFTTYAYYGQVLATIDNSPAVIYDVRTK